MSKCLENAATLAKYVFSSVYIALQYVLPTIQEILCAILQHRFLVCVYRAVLLPIYRVVILPLWNFLSPWFIPLALLTVVLSCGMKLVELDVLAQLLSGLDGGIKVTSILFGGATAAVSFFVLALHGALHLCRRRQPDPLALPGMATVLSCWAHAISFPVWLIWKLSTPCVRYILSPVRELLVTIFEKLFRCAAEVPWLSIPIVVLFNVTLLYFLPQLLGSGSSRWWLIQVIAGPLREMQSALAAGRVTDSGLALVFIMVVQIGAQDVVASLLDQVREVRSRQTGDVLSVEELNAIAGTMTDPRQCCRCGFGPVDHAGCTDLRAHHGEVAVRAGAGRARRQPEARAICER